MKAQPVKCFESNQPASQSKTASRRRSGLFPAEAITSSIETRSSPPFFRSDEGAAGEMLRVEPAGQPVEDGQQAALGAFPCGSDHLIDRDEEFAAFLPI